MSYLVDFQPLALKAMRLEALLPTKALTQIKDKVYIDRDTVSLLIIFQYRNEVGLCDALTPLQSAGLGIYQHQQLFSLSVAVFVMQ